MRSLLFAAFLLAAVSAENRDPGSESSTGGSSHVSAAVAAETADTSNKPVAVPPKQEPVHHVADSPLIVPQFGVPTALHGAHPAFHAFQGVNPAFVLPQNFHYHGGGQPVYRKLPVRSHENHVGLFPVFGKYAVEDGHQSHIYPSHNGFYNFANYAPLGDFGAFGNHDYFGNYQHGFNYVAAPDFGGHANFAAQQKPVDFGKAQKGSHNVEKKTVNLSKTANAGSKKEPSSKFGLHSILKYFSNHVKHTKVDPKGSHAGTTKYDKNIVKYTGGAEKTKLDHVTNTGNHHAANPGSDQLGNTGGHFFGNSGHSLEAVSHFQGSHQLGNTPHLNSGIHLLGNTGHSENTGSHHIGSQPEIIVGKFPNKIGGHPYINLENIKFSPVSAYEGKSPAYPQSNPHLAPQYPPIPEYLAVPQSEPQNSGGKNHGAQYSEGQHAAPQYPSIPQYLLVPQHPSRSPNSGAQHSEAQYHGAQYPGQSAQQYPGVQYFGTQYPAGVQPSVVPQYYAAVNPTGAQYFARPQHTTGPQYSAEPHSAGVQFVTLTGGDAKQNLEHAGLNPNYDHTKLHFQNLLHQYSQPQAAQYVQEHPALHSAKYVAENVRYVQEQPASGEKNVKYVAENVHYVQEHPGSAGKNTKNIQYVQDSPERNFKYVSETVQYAHPEAAEQNVKYANVQYVQLPSQQENAKYPAGNREGGKPQKVAHAESQNSDQNGGNQRLASNSGYTGSHILDLTGSQIGGSAQYATHPAFNGANFGFSNFGFSGMPNSENAVTIDLTGTLKEGVAYTAQRKGAQKQQGNEKHVTPDFTGNQGTHQQHFIQYVYSPAQENVKFGKADEQDVVRHSGSEKFEFQPQRQNLQNQDYQYQVSEGQSDKVKNNLIRFGFTPETSRQESKEQEKRNDHEYQKSEYKGDESQSPKYKSQESQSPKYRSLESKSVHSTQKSHEYSGLDYKSQDFRRHNTEDKTAEYRNKAQSPNYRSQEYYVEYQSPIYKNQLVYETDDNPSYKGEEYQSNTYKYSDFKPVYQNPTHIEDRKENVANYKVTTDNKEQQKVQGGKSKEIQDRKLQGQKLVDYKNIQGPQKFGPSKSEAQDYQNFEKSHNSEKNRQKLEENQQNLERKGQNLDQKYLNLGEYYIQAAEQSEPKQQGNAYSLDGEHNYVYYIRGQGEHTNQEQQNVAYILDKDFEGNQDKKQHEQNVAYIVDKSFLEENGKHSYILDKNSQKSQGQATQSQQNLSEEAAKHQYSSQEYHGDSSQKPSDLSKQHSSQFPQKASYRQLSQGQVPSEQFAQQFHQQSQAQNNGDYRFIRFTLSQDHEVQSTTPTSESNFMDSAKQESMRALKEEVLRSFQKDYDLGGLKGDKESGEILKSKQEDYNLSYSNSSDKDEGDDGGEVKKYEASTVSSHGDH